MDNICHRRRFLRTKGKRLQVTYNQDEQTVKNGYHLQMQNRYILGRSKENKKVVPTTKKTVMTYTA